MRYILCLSLLTYRYVLIGRVVISFLYLFRPDFRLPTILRPLFEGIYALTDPPLNLLRRYVPQPQGLPIDLSFVILLVLLRILERVLGC
ncbi:MAG: YggT family protein [Actinomycetota bacterium]